MTNSRVSGAIDLAAKSAGIIPGSPCRELNPPTADTGTLLHTAPIVDAETDAQLLQHSVPEVSGAHLHTQIGSFASLGIYT